MVKLLFYVRRNKKFNKCAVMEFYLNKIPQK